MALGLNYTLCHDYTAYLKATVVNSVIMCVCVGSPSGSAVCMCVCVQSNDLL